VKRGAAGVCVCGGVYGMFLVEMGMGRGKGEGEDGGVVSGEENS